MKDTFEVVMIGNTAVGKTSMLAALSNELDEYNIQGSVSLEPTTHEFKMLQNQWNEMIEKVETQEAFTTLSEGLEGTLVDFVEHKFDFKVDGNKKAAVLFTDTRGGMTKELDKKLVERVNNAFGVFCVIDASVLMECPQSKNEQLNCPKFIKKLLNEVYNDDDLQQPKFVAFILTKCEKYMASMFGRRSLAKAFHKHYDGIISMLKKTNFEPSMYLLAIQTMCCVSFLKLDENGLPQFRVKPSQELKTKDCAYPLVVLLKNLILEMDSKVSPWGRILQFLGWADDLRNYLVGLDKNVKTPKLFEEL